MTIKPNRQILKIKPYVPGKPIEEVKRELGLKDVIKLASNENPYGPSPRVLKAIAQAASTANRYPDGACYALRQEIAGRLKLLPEQLVFGCGSDEVIVLALRAFINPGDEVVMAKPSFLVYSIASTAVGAKLVEVPLKGLSYDLAAMKKAVTKKTKIIFIGNPDNPSGLFVTKAQTAEFLQGLSDDVLVFFDEAYFEFVNDKDYPDSLALLKSRKNIIVARTFSKFYGLAGLRIGYAAAHVQVADFMNRAREPFNVTSLAQAAALAALKDAAYYSKILKRLNHQRDTVCRRLDQMGIEYSKGATNFIQVRVPRDSREVTQELIEKGVIVRDMSVWGLAHFIRVTIGTPVENKKFLKVLREIL